MAQFHKAKAKSHKSEMTAMDNKKHFPKIHLPLDLLPEAKDWEVGKKYAIALEVKMTGIEMNEFSNESSYEVLGAKVISKKGNSANNKVKRY